MINNKTKSYNYRQIELISTKIKEFKKGLIGLGALIDNLEILLGYLQFIEKKWEKSFRLQIVEMESDYACVVHEGRNYFTSEEQNRINAAIKNIKKLIEEYKKENFTKEDIFYFENIED